jgi:hypothetical protein
MEQASKSQALSLKGQCHEIFASGFFHETSTPEPLKIMLGLFRIFSKFAKIFASHSKPLVSATQAEIVATGTAGVVDTGGKNDKITEFIRGAKLLQM